MQATTLDDQIRGVFSARPVRAIQLHGQQSFSTQLTKPLSVQLRLQSMALDGMNDMASERWQEAVLSPEQQGKCYLLGIRIMYNSGSKFSALTQFSVRQNQGNGKFGEYIPVNNLLASRADGTREVVIFRTADAAIRGAASKDYFFHLTR